MKQEKKEYEYFRIIEFRERYARPGMCSVIHLDIALKELSYQVFAQKKNMTGIIGVKTEDSLYQTDQCERTVSGKIIRKGVKVYEL